MAAVQTKRGRESIDSRPSSLLMLHRAADVLTSASAPEVRNRERLQIPRGVKADDGSAVFNDVSRSDLKRSVSMPTTEDTQKSKV